LFVPDKILDADIETTTKGEYTNHNIKQVYVGGKIVSSKRKAWGGKSAEEIKSIEQQVAVKAVVDSYIAGKLLHTDNEVKLMHTWLTERLTVNNRKTVCKNHYLNQE
jgi:hypothetical protein